MRRLLVVVDYQNDFITGSLGFKKALAIKPVILNLVKEFHQEKSQIIFTKDTHDADYLNTEEGKHLPIIHCVTGTKGIELEEELLALVLKDDLIYDKNTFGSDQLYHHLSVNHYDEIVFCGIVTNICVLANAILAKTASKESKITIIKNGVASNSDELDSATLKIFESLGMDVQVYGY